MQNERGEGTSKEDFEILGPLPRKNIDTGMGVERVACLLQGVDNVYETDLLRPVIDTVAARAPRGYGVGSHEDDVRYRIIADHSRTAAILIGDGVSPGNDGRGYVLRRLLRRVIRSAKLLGIDSPIVGDLMTTVRDAMGPSYPELVNDFDRIHRIAVAEETAFNRTLASGSRLFEEAASATKASGTTVLSGTDAFTLHDTYGFPLELTLEMAAEAGLSVDEEGFRGLMAEQRQRAKADAAARKQAHSDLSAYRELVDAGPTEFTGFDELVSEATILGIFVDGKRVPVVAHGGNGDQPPRPCRVDPGPHAVLRRGRRTDRRRGQHQRRLGCGEGCRHRCAEDRQNAVGAPRQRGVRRIRRGRHRHRRRRPAVAARRDTGPFRYPHGACRTATSAGPQRGSGRLAEPAGVSAVRLQLAGAALRGAANPD